MDSHLVEKCVLLESFPETSRPKADISAFLNTVYGVQPKEVHIQATPHLTTSNTPNWILLCNSEQDAWKICHDNIPYQYQGASIQLKTRHCNLDEIPEEWKTHVSAQAESMVSIGKCEDSMVSVNFEVQGSEDAPGYEERDLDSLNYSVHEQPAMTESYVSISPGYLSSGYQGQFSQLNVYQRQEYQPPIYQEQSSYQYYNPNLPPPSPTAPSPETQGHPELAGVPGFPGSSGTPGHPGSSGAPGLQGSAGVIGHPVAASVHPGSSWVPEYPIAPEYPGRAGVPRHPRPAGVIGAPGHPVAPAYLGSAGHPTAGHPSYPGAEAYLDRTEVPGPTGVPGHPLAPAYPGVTEIPAHPGPAGVPAYQRPGGVPAYQSPPGARVYMAPPAYTGAPVYSRPPGVHAYPGPPSAPGHRGPFGAPRHPTKYQMNLQGIPIQPPVQHHQEQPLQDANPYHHQIHPPPNSENPGLPTSSLVYVRSESSLQMTEDHHQIPHSQSAPVLRETSLSDSGDEFKPPTQRSENMIEVHGSDLSSSGEDKYRYFFENPRKGGGDIEDFQVTEDNILLIAFKDSPEAESIGKRQNQDENNMNGSLQTSDDTRCSRKGLVKEGKAKVGGTEVTIKQHYQPPIYKKKALLEYKNAHMDQSSMELRYYIEARSQGEVTNVEAGSKEDALLLTFQEPVETQRLQSACRQRPFKENVISVREVPATNVIHIHGVPDSVSSDTVRNYFETPRSGNETNSEVNTVDSLEEDSAYLLHFGDYHGIEKILKVSHTLGNHPITACLYHKCIGLTSLGQVQERRTRPYDAKSIHLNQVDALIVRFLNKSQPLMTQLNKKMSDQNLTLSISQDSQLYVTSKEGSVKHDATYSERILQAANSILEENVSLYRLQIPVDLKGKMESKILELGFDPDEAKAYHGMESVVIVGSEGKAAEMKEKLEAFLQTSVVTEETAVVVKQPTGNKEQLTTQSEVKPLAAVYLSAMNFEEDVRKSFPGVKVKVDLKANEVQFEGPEDSVTAAKVKMYQTVNAGEIIEVQNISKEQIVLLEKTNVKNEVTSRLRENDIIAAWMRKQSAVEVISNSKSGAEETRRILLTTVNERIFPLENDMLSLLSSDPWDSLNSQLTEVFPDRFSINYVQNKNYLLIVGLNDNVDNIYDTISRFFEANAIGKTVVIASRGVFRFIQAHLDKEVEMIVKDLKSSHVQISLIDDGSKFIVHGSEEGMKKCKHRLDQLITKVMHHKELMQKAGMAKMLTSEKGTKMVSHVERLERCTIEVGSQATQEASSSCTMDIEPTATVVAVTNLPESRKIYVRQGDITGFRVGAIVNAANNRLDHCGGLAKAIVDKGGAAIQDECRKYVMRHGEVLDGNAVLSGPGNLPCDVIIHAVGPRWQDGSHREKDYLTEAVIKCMELTASRSCVSVAIPGLSTGIFGYPTDSATKVITTTVRDYFRQNRDSVIKDVYFCDNENNTINGFVKAMKEVFGEGNMHIQSRGHGAGAPPRGEKRTHTSKNTGPSVVIVKGQIAKQKADVIVNSTNQKLELREAGAVSKSLAEEAGPSLQSACSKNYPQGIKSGSVAVTRGGNLQCKRVYHVFLPAFSTDQQAKKDVTDLVMNCLTSASFHTVSSMAFPALGTGGLKYPRELVADTMFTAIQDYWTQNPGSPIKDVRIVLYSKDQETITVFENQKEKHGHSDQHPQIRRRFVSRYSGTDIVLVKGEIAKQKADVIVNSTNQKLDLKEAGAVSKSLAEEAGPELESACSEKYPQGIKSGSVAVTRGGKLQCKRVYHVFLPAFSTDLQAVKDVRDLVTNCLKSASSHTVSSMAFPALGTGGLKYPRELVADTMFTAIQDYWAQNPGSPIKDVRIVLYTKDQETITAFEKQKETHGISDQDRQTRRPSVSQHSGADIILVKGEIAKEKADVIVNSTNQKLDLKEAGAVSKSLAEEAGPELESACSEKYPQGIKSGSVAVTRGGKLQCKRVYHVFLPAFSTDLQAKKDVRDLVMTCLTSASSHTVSSIVFPALGTGGLKYPRELVADTMFTAIQDYWTQNPGSPIKDVRIVLYSKDQETITAFEEQKERRRQQQQRRFHRKPNLVRGSIIRFEGNVIVNPTDVGLDLTRGRLSRSIAEAAGPTLASEIKRKFPNGVPNSGLAVTSAGLLNAKQVYHVVVKNWDRAHDVQPISTAVTTCLEVAHKSRYTSILFPTLGIGSTGYDKTAAAKTMYAAIDAFWTNSPGTTLTQIKIVIYDKDNDVAKIFEQEKMSFYRMPDSRKGRQLKASVKKHSEPEEPVYDVGGGVTFGNIQFKLVHGDLLKDRVDCIITNVHSQFDLNKGVINQGILKMFGDQAQSGHKQKVTDLKKKGFTVTEVTGASFNKIIHFEQFYFKHDLLKILKTCFKEADKSHCSSVALPSLGQGHEGGVPEHRFCQYLYDTLIGLAKLTYVTEVHLVVLERAMYERFIVLLDNLLDTQGLKGKNIFKKMRDVFPKQAVPPQRRRYRSYPRHVSECDPETGLEVSFFSDTEEAIQAAQQKLQDAYNKEFGNIAKDIEALKTLDEDKIQRLHSEAKQRDVVIDVNQPLGRIHVQGIKDDANAMVQRTFEICLEQKDDEKAAILGSVVQWYYMEMLEEDELVKYDSETNKEIEKAFRENKEFHVLEDTDGDKYVVDFKEMVEYREDDHSARCPLIRKDLIKAAEFDPPPSWEDMSPTENLKVFRVSPSSDEYARVSAKFASAKQQIVKIERVQNKTMYKQYQAKKQLFEQRTSNTKPCESELWHGTATNAIPSINKDGFNRSYCGKNAVAYGNGVYFAVNPSYSTQDKYARPDGMGNKYIYLVDVLTGEYTMGKSGMRVPPPVDPAFPSVLHDSVVENVKYPTMFVIFNDTQAYPKYLITFK